MIIDVVRNRRRESSTLLERIKKEKIKACTSEFSMLEVMASEQESAYVMKFLGKGWTIEEVIRERHARKLTSSELEDAYERFYNGFVIPYSENIEVYYLTKEGWAFARELMTRVNLSAPDAIHVATALDQKCDCFVTSDTNLITSIKDQIKACTPGEMLSKLQT